MVPATGLGRSSPARALSGLQRPDRDAHMSAGGTLCANPQQKIREHPQDGRRLHHLVMAQLACRGETLRAKRSAELRTKESRKRPGEDDRRSVARLVGCFPCSPRAPMVIASTGSRNANLLTG